MSAKLRVAAGILQAGDGRVLLAQRLAGTPYAGYWEFPGGKLEPGEDPQQALARELDEELGIQVLQSAPWLRRTYRYPHADVDLNFLRVFDWRGEAHGRDGQALSWETPGAFGVEPLLPANGVVLDALRLPTVYGISMAEDMGDDAFLERAAVAMQRGLRLLQLREKTFAESRRNRLAQRLIALARQYGARVLLNGDAHAAERLGFDGVHLSSAALRATTERPRFGLCAASCHDAEELAQAVALDLDFAVLGPVQATPSHAHATLLGWERFASLVASTAIPVFALGGLETGDLRRAQLHGAHGVALRGAAWAQGETR